MSVVLTKGIVQNLKVFDKQEKKFNDKDFDLIESILRKYINLDNYCIKKRRWFYRVLFRRRVYKWKLEWIFNWRKINRWIIKNMKK